MNPILLILLLLILFGLPGTYPGWGYSRGWGYAPMGGVGLIVIVLLLVFFFRR